MSNEYKDWVEDLKSAPIDSLDHKRWLLMKYPWLEIENNEDHTLIDSVPRGWAKLCEDLCAELKPLLEKVGYVDKYRLCQVREKLGRLRWYEWDIPAAIDEEYFALIRKYEDLSYKTCCICGAPATKRSMSPFCDKCAEDIHDKFEPIEN